jgi:hypothetical protein
MTTVLSIALLIVTAWSIFQAYLITFYRKRALIESKSADEVIAAQQNLNASQETLVKGLRSYMEVKEAMLFDSIEKLVTNLRFWMPDESQVVPDKEGDQWYSSVNAIFEAEKRVRDIKESR